MATHHGVPGIELNVERFDFASVVRDELALVNRMREEKYRKVLQHLEHVTFIEGHARFALPTDVDVNGRRLHAPQVIIATGSTATVPPVSGRRDVGYVTHIEALTAQEKPEALVVIGAGAVGLEFGQMWWRWPSCATSRN